MTQPAAAAAPLEAEVTVSEKVTFPNGIPGFAHLDALSDHDRLVAATCETTSPRWSSPTNSL